MNQNSQIFELGAKVDILKELAVRNAKSPCLKNEKTSKRADLNAGIHLDRFTEAVVFCFDYFASESEIAEELDAVGIQRMQSMFA